MEQFEITLIELNRHLAYEDKNSAINCYNKLNNTYNKILDSNNVCKFLKIYFEKVEPKVMS